MKKFRKRDIRDYGYVRVAAGVPHVLVGNVDHNVDNHLEMLGEWETRGVDVGVFTECSVTGYTPGILFQQLELQASAQKGVHRLAVQGGKIFKGLYLAGVPLVIGDTLQNCGVFMQGGKMLCAFGKEYLAGNNQFSGEPQWFRRADLARKKYVIIDGVKVPFFRNFILACVNMPNLRVAAEICEAVWTPIPPSCFQGLAGANVILNLSASNELVGKVDYRRNLVSQQSARLMCAYVYASCGPGESTTDVIFGGHALIGNNGNLVAESKRFLTKSHYILADIDVDKLVFDRVRVPSFAESKVNLDLVEPFEEIPFHLPVRKQIRTLLTPPDGRPAVPKDPAKRTERCEEIINMLVALLDKRLDYLGNPQFVYGDSGGKDSRLASLIAMIRQIRAGRPLSDIHAFTMPGFGTTTGTKDNATAFMELAGFTHKTIDIRELCLAHWKAVGHNPFGIDLKGMTLRKLGKLLRELPDGSKDLVFENVQAGFRTHILLRYKFTLGTGDLSEAGEGWCTFGADQIGNYNVNIGVFKTLVVYLLQYVADVMLIQDGELFAHFGAERASALRAQIQDTIDQAVSPELLPTGKDGKIKQKTNDILGPDEVRDFYQTEFQRWGTRPEKILWLASQATFDGTYAEEDLRNWLMQFIDRFFRQQYKSSCSPDGGKIGSVSKNPRADWRMPSDADPTIWLNAIKAIEWLEAEEAKV